MKTQRYGYWVLFWMFVLVLAVTAVGCDAKKEENKTAVSRRAVPEKQTPEKPEYDFPDEIYGDPEIWSEPRIQFVWQHPNEKWQSIWSMKTDGTDVRRAAGPELLSIDAGERYAINSRPVRSPDNRYIAVKVSNYSKYDVSHYMIFDMKSKARKVFPLKGTPPCFVWTKDSQSLFFYGDTMYEYHSDTQRLTKPPAILANGLYLIDDDKVFLGLGYRELEFYDRQGRLVRKVGLPVSESIENRSHYISNEKDKLVFTVRGVHYYVLSLRPPYPVLFQCESNEYSIGNATFLPGGDELFGLFYNRKGLSVLNLDKREQRVLQRAELKSSIKFFTLINANPKNKQ